ncbi:pinopsin [Leptinotarsa decemlineata]|uniref:pinopsin n=1 Tax=Leptinotarsa decemlineata TaxID=7539 RepID=UPI003D30AB74
MTEIIISVSNTTRRAFANDGNGEHMLMSAGGYIAAAIMLFFIGFFGFFLNLCVIVLMWKDKQLWTPLNIILFNLVCSDFSVSILGNPLTLASALSYRWIFGKTMCKMYGFFMSLLGITSITTLTVLAFERYMIVSRPFRSRGLSRKNAVYLVVGIWIYSLALTVPPLLGWGKYVNEAANISCSVNWEEQSANAMSYILFLFAFGLVLPLIVILFSYAHIIITMRQSKIHMGQTTKAEGRVAYMVFLMIVAFIVAWSPYAISALLVQFVDSSFISPAAGVAPALLAKSSICYNPIIYVGLNSQFRQVLKNFLGMNDNNVGSTCETYDMAVSKFVSTTVVNSPVNGGRVTVHTPRNMLQIKQMREKSSLLNDIRLNKTRFFEEYICESANGTSSRI